MDVSTADGSDISRVLVCAGTGDWSVVSSRMVSSKTSISVGGSCDKSTSGHLDLTIDSSHDIRFFSVAIYLDHRSVS